MDERKLVGIIVGLECRFMHQATDREVGHHESEELLSNQIWSPASQDDFGATQMGLQFVQGGLDFPAFMIESSEFDGRSFVVIENRCDEP
jgi:hypothetical protein